MKGNHFLLVVLPAQGHINPMLQLGKCLIHAGAGRVTFATTVHGLTQIKTRPSLENLYYASFSDGFDDGIKPTNDPHHIMSELKRAGSQTLAELLSSLSEDRNPVSFLIYTVLLPWAADVARYMSIPSAFLCIQSATAFALYYCFFKEHDGVYDSNENSPPSSVDIHGLPPFTSKDLPSFLLPNDQYALVAPLFQHHIQALEKESNPCVLLNTFDCLEEEAIKAISCMNPIPIGPLVSFAFSDESNPTYSSCGSGIDLFEKPTPYIQWLNSKPKGSVVYVSFGSLAVLQRNQMEKILLGLIGSCRPFLWVVRPSGSNDKEFEEMIKNKVSEEVGLIVPWCSQTEVLAHESIGCFLMHCGWNSTVESLSAGVPVVGFPQFSDQTTNAKMVDEVWRSGVRTRVSDAGTVESEEIERCLEMVMGGGERGEEIRRNAEKWKGLALEAVVDGGSSYKNLKAFVEMIKSSC